MNVTMHPHTGLRGSSHLVTFRKLGQLTARFALAQRERDYDCKVACIVIYPKIVYFHEICERDDTTIFCHWVGARSWVLILPIISYID